MSSTRRAPRVALSSLGLFLAACQAPPAIPDDAGSSDALSPSDGAADAALDPARIDAAPSQPDASVAPDARAALDGGGRDDAAIGELPDAHAPPDAALALADAHVPLDARPLPPDAGSDAGSSCELPPLRGGTEAGVSSEVCVLLGDPIRTRSADDLAVSVANDGTVYVVFSPEPFVTELARYLPEPGPSCVLRRDPSFSFPGEWGPIDVAPSGALYALSRRSGWRSAAWNGPMPGTCSAMPAMGAEGPIDVGADGDIVARDSFGAPVTLSTSTCTWTSRSEPWTSANGVTRVEDDVVVAGRGIGCSVARFHGAERVFCSTEMLWTPNDLARCGDDVCVRQGGANTLVRIDGATGARVHDYPTATLFDRLRIGPLDGSPDGSTLVVSELTPSTTCPGTLQLTLWRVTGF